MGAPACCFGAAQSARAQVTCVLRLTRVCACLSVCCAWTQVHVLHELRVLALQPQPLQPLRQALAAVNLSYLHAIRTQRAGGMGGGGDAVSRAGEVRPASGMPLPPLARRVGLPGVLPRGDGGGISRPGPDGLTSRTPPPPERRGVASAAAVGPASRDDTAASGALSHFARAPVRSSMAASQFSALTVESLASMGLVDEGEMEVEEAGPLVGAGAAPLRPQALRRSKTVDGGVVAPAPVSMGRSATAPPAHGAAAAGAEEHAVAEGAGGGSAAGPADGVFGVVDPATLVDPRCDCVCCVRVF